MTSSSADLLPGNSVALERAVVESSGIRTLDPDIIRLLWDADKCPPQYLPYLAWALAVDFWELAKTDQQRRNLIKGAIQWHRKRGTPWAVKEALAAFEFGGFVFDWDLKNKGGHWAEFDVEFNVTDQSVTEETYAQVLRLIDAFKAGRSHLRNLRTVLTTQAAVFVACATYGGDTVTVYPLSPKDISAQPAGVSVGVGAHDFATTTIYPRTP
jgi:phage tail P2-like protein